MADVHKEGFYLQRCFSRADLHIVPTLSCSALTMAPSIFFKCTLWIRTSDASSAHPESMAMTATAPTKLASPCMLYALRRRQAPL